MDTTPEFLQQLLETCRLEGLTPCVDLLITNRSGEILVQKRSSTRKLFPNCWEVPGGHVEDGENLEDTLCREIKEELGLDLGQITALVESFDWEYNSKKFRNFQFLGTTFGIPKIMEPEKTIELKWINEDNVNILLENRSNDNNDHFRIVKKALKMIQTQEHTLVHNNIK